MLSKIKKFVYQVIRSLFVSNIDSNEDFVYVICSKQVLTRVLTCSEKCSTILDRINE